MQDNDFICPKNRQFRKKVEMATEIEKQDINYLGMGVYDITINGVIVYVGKSTHISMRVADHCIQIMNGNPANKYKVLREAKENGYEIQFNVLDKCYQEDEMGYLEGYYIRQYLPPLNQQIPLEEDWKRYKSNNSAKTITFQELEDNYLSTTVDDKTI